MKECGMMSVCFSFLPVSVAGVGACEVREGLKKDATNDVKPNKEEEKNQVSYMQLLIPNENSASKVFLSPPSSLREEGSHLAALPCPQLDEEVPAVEGLGLLVERAARPEGHRLAARARGEVNHVGGLRRRRCESGLFSLLRHRQGPAGRDGQQERHRRARQRAEPPADATPPHLSPSFPSLVFGCGF
uniref:Uncharacterized protein n=1 Tax=Chloropicon laureae TaxID=464258 RepID=A0A7S3E0E3_9CHLO